MSSLKMYRDADDSARAESPTEEPSLSILAQFLESDIQDDPELCHDLIDTINEQEIDSEEQLEILGNSFSMLLVGDVIVFECVADEEDDGVYSLSREVVLEELGEWLKFLG